MIINSSKVLSKARLIIVSGPTASGKTDLSLELASYYKTEIISFDSRQFYSELEIGTAKPSSDQLNSVKHHFIGNKSIHEEYNAEIYSQESRNRIDELSSYKENLILVGGSGLYLDALLYSFDPMPEVDKSIRAQLNQIKQEKGLPVLQEMLLERDPIYYKMVDINNPQRIIRALEICLSTLKPYSDYRKGVKAKIPYNTFKICLSPPLDLLYKRIENRVDEMFKNGLEEEARKFLSYRHLNPLKTVGYTELFDFFGGKISFQDSVSLIKQHTRNFAKRQLTWFRKDPENHWINSHDKQGIIQLLENTR